MSWIFLAIIASVFFGFYNYFSGKTGQLSNPLLASFILYLSATIFTFLVMIFSRINISKDQIFSNGAKFALLAGLTAGIADIFYLLIFNRKVNISIVLPTVFTLTTIIGSFLGILLEKEDISLTKILGISLSIVGVIIVNGNSKGI